MTAATTFAGKAGKYVYTSIGETSLGNAARHAYKRVAESRAVGAVKDAYKSVAESQAVATVKGTYEAASKTKLGQGVIATSGAIWSGAKTAVKVGIGTGVAKEGFDAWKITDDLELSRKLKDDGFNEEAEVVLKSAQYRTVAKIMRGGSLLTFFSGGWVKPILLSTGADKGAEWLEEKAKEMELAVGIERDHESQFPSFVVEKIVGTVNSYIEGREETKNKLLRNQKKWGAYNPSDWENPTDSKTNPITTASSDTPTNTDKSESSKNTPKNNAAAISVEKEQSSSSSDKQRNAGLEESYTISAGETLSGISRKLKLGREGVSKIVAENDLADPNHIIAGAKLRIPKA